MNILPLFVLHPPPTRTSVTGAPADTQASVHGVKVSNIPSLSTGNAVACAEHAILLTLALLRDLPACQAAVQERRLGEPCGETLFGKRVLVLGFGGISRAVIPRLAAFGAFVSCVRLSQWSAEDLVCSDVLDRLDVHAAASSARWAACLLFLIRWFYFVDLESTQQVNSPVDLPPTPTSVCAVIAVHRGRLCATLSLVSCLRRPSCPHAGTSHCTTATATGHCHGSARCAANSRHHHRCGITGCEQSWHDQCRLPSPLQVRSR
jgi:hypothetical protein